MIQIDFNGFSQKNKKINSLLWHLFYFILRYIFILFGIILLFSIGVFFVKIEVGLILIVYEICEVFLSDFSSTLELCTFFVCTLHRSVWLEAFYSGFSWVWKVGWFGNRHIVNWFIVCILEFDRLRILDDVC